MDARNVAIVLGPLLLRAPSAVDDASLMIEVAASNGIVEYLVGDLQLSTLLL